ncbi:hypothetical protein PIB30_091013 [Stylosanthes scabra]|uniref:RING-type domain-containing protein n=1 Tax=Stylosanthes scabra TaxID=79078 RepID=A0ABU6XW79_9FABA|nr:hypothetical protein [Stylosanthes scabra]
MGFYAEDSSSAYGLKIGQAIYEAALIVAVLRWILCLVFRLIKDRRTTPPSSSSSCTLVLTTFREVMERLPETEEDTSCAVCLNQMKMEDEVRELMNCYHVFHKECIDRWLDHDDNNHNPTCPLCRAPLITLNNSCHTSSESSYGCAPPSPQPSWAVERLLYLFGDDLLPC